MITGGNIKMDFYAISIDSLANSEKNITKRAIKNPGIEMPTKAINVKK